MEYPSLLSTLPMPSDIWSTGPSFTYIQIKLAHESWHLEPPIICSRKLSVEGINGGSCLTEVPVVLFVLCTVCVFGPLFLSLKKKKIIYLAVSDLSCSMQGL